jgi:hypothetical protein
MEVSGCVRCGGRLQPGAQFCPGCGMNQIPTWLATGPTPGPAGYPPAAYPPAGYPPAAYPPAGYPPRPAFAAAVVDRPFGIALLTLAEIVVAVVGLYVTWLFVRYAGWRFGADETMWGVIDLAQAGAYLGLALLGFSIAPRLWRMEPGVWKTAVTLSLSLAGLAALDVVFSLLFGWYLTPTDFVGIAAHLSLICYLNMTHVRKIFGRPPAGFLQNVGL